VGSIQALFMAAATAVPLVLAIRIAGGEIIALYQLHPLWRVLVQATPEVTFPGTVPHSRLRDLLTALPWIHRKLYRQIIEIRDALLVLGRYVTPEIARRAHEHISRHSVPSAASTAMVTACIMEAALNAKTAGKTPSTTGKTISDHGGSDRSSEVRWLCSVAAAHRSPVVQAFTDTLRWSSDNEGEDNFLELHNERRTLPNEHASQSFDRQLGREFH
jgi:hypothetical protein